MFKVKNSFGEWYQPHDSFVVRNPLFPVDIFFSWKTEPGIDAATSKEILRKSLREFYLQPIAQEALYIGSPDLHEQLLLWLDNKIEKPDKKEKTELSLVKYMIRMCTRCTPYGLFASCTFGNFGDNTNIELSGKNSFQRFGRLDMDYVCEVHSHLLKQKEISDQLRFYLNTSLYSIGDQWRYIEHRFNKETGRSYHLVQIEQSVYLEKIFSAARFGQIPAELAAIITDEDVSLEEALEFIYELISNQVLVSEIEPTVTGEEYFSTLLCKLKTLEHTEKYIEQFEKTVKEFNNIKSGDDVTKNKFYPQIVQHLQQLDVPLHVKTLIQVDSYRPAESCTLNKKVNDEILKGASLLQLLTTDDSVKDSFTDFKNAFINRYEGQWIPLVEVLDTESGIGYGKFATSGMEESPLIDKLPIGNGFAASNKNDIADAETFKWQLYQDAISKNKTEVIIDDKTIEQLSKKEHTSTSLADSICMLLKINAHSTEEIDNGNYEITLQPPSGPSGGNLLGRFCHLHPEIEKFTQSLLQQEEAHRPDCVFAEIIHLPESRIGNILMRPVLRQYEIPFLCGTPLSDEFQIPVTDLLVSIAANKVVLRSKRLGKEVIPRMTTAHNFNMTTLPVYQFLCDLQYQQIRHTGWQWGILDNRSFLPRVSYGNFILSKARWMLTKEDVKDCIKKNDEDLLQAFIEIINSKNIPDYILLSQSDNELLLHLKNIFCVKLLMNELNKQETVILTESLDYPNKCWIKSPEGIHAGEFIVAFSKKITKPVTAVNNISVHTEIKNMERFFPVGSEWLYAKIYCGTKTAEKILCDVLKPLTEKLISEKIIDRYFFIRYHDTANHIRIRFHSAVAIDFWKEVICRMQQCLQPFMDNHSLYNLQFETYQRELERYGFDTMEQGETIFYHQSAAVLNFITMLDGDEGEQYRWKVALKAMDLFLDDFHYTVEQKCELVKLLNKKFSDEFKVGAAERKIISERFSSHKALIQQLMKDEWDEDENLDKAIRFFKIDHDDYYRAIEEILNSASVHHDRQQLNLLMASYLHMFINRFFISNQRKTELIIYEYLFKYYDSKIAREKKQIGSNIPELINKDS